MRGFLLDLAKAGGRVAREYFAHVSAKDVRTKAERDYVSHVDHLVEDTLIRRIRSHHPDHQILGEEGVAGHQGGFDPLKPLWIIDPIDGTTNFIRGIPAVAISIAFCEHAAEPTDAIVYDPLRDEAFVAEGGTGLWLNNQRIYASGCNELGKALVATAMPFRFPQCHDEALAVFGAVQRCCDDQRRGGSAALDLAYVAAGRLDAYYELGIYPWDTAAGELLVRCAGGAASDYRGRTGGLLGRRSIVAAASPTLHAALLDQVKPLAHWLDRAPFAPGAAPDTSGPGTA